MTNLAVPLSTKTCDRCTHKQDTLNAKCAKGYGGLFRLSVARPIDCVDFMKVKQQGK